MDTATIIVVVFVAVGIAAMVIWLLRTGGDRDESYSPMRFSDSATKPFEAPPDRDSVFATTDEPPVAEEPVVEPPVAELELEPLPEPVPELVPEPVLEPLPTPPPPPEPKPEPKPKKVAAPPPKPAPKPKPEPKLEPKPEPKVEPKPEPKPEPKVEPKPEPKVEAPPPPPPPAPVSTAGASPTADLEEADKRHKDARRLARLLVSEIKLYNEAAVTQGRANADLYTRLKKDIDRSVDVYHQRIPDEVRAQFDYLYDEMVRQLADGDASRLGPGAPTPNPPL